MRIQEGKGYLTIICKREKFDNHADARKKIYNQRRGKPEKALSIESRKDGCNRQVKKMNG